MKTGCTGGGGGALNWCRGDFWRWRGGRRRGTSHSYIFLSN